ncbi:hypothetical protein FTV88_2831 [Heliorestis convoluta]|uniref:Uncharacterized protein n=1 Tax=Heliorestis convoluta TaxID=356322 RepID=A0A5Q2N9H5_9FIRM|nr:hypothetical protein FTV88_2831 [Heliorestis convoluta]
MPGQAQPFETTMTILSSVYGGFYFSEYNSFEKDFERVG